jgi:hypothetical protein
MRRSLSGLLLVAGLLAAGPAPAQNTPQKVWTLPSPVVRLGYCSLAVSTSAVGFSGCSGGIPSAPPGTLGPVEAIVEAVGAMNFRDDGTAPTSSAGGGFPLTAGQNWTFTTVPLSQVQFIAGSATTLNVLFYAIR